MVDIYRGAKGLGYEEINTKGKEAFHVGEKISFRESGGKNSSGDGDRKLKTGRISEVNPSHIVVDVEIDIIGGGKRKVRNTLSYVDIYSQIAVIEEKNIPSGMKGRAVRETEEALMEDLADALLGAADSSK